MFVGTVLLALVIGALAGGSLPRLAALRLRWLPLLVSALLLRVIAALAHESAIFETVPVGWAYTLAYVLIFAWLWANWRVPGLQLASVGIAANALAVALSAGRMPVWSAAFSAAGFRREDIAGDPFHYLLETDTPADFVARGGIFGDVVPIPLPIVQDVMSIGDVLLALGIGWAIVHSMTRLGAPRRRIRMAPAVGGAPLGVATAGFSGAVALNEASGAAGAAVAVLPSSAGVQAAISPVEAEALGSPYLRLARNRNFSLLWLGQLVSLLGDRIHIVALGVLVATRGEPLELGLTFAATALPNVVLGPLAGALVDRWDRRTTMIACDLTRAALVLLVPVAIDVHIGLVYLLSFALATVTLLFRPAKTAVVPQVVGERDLMVANSANGISETLADLIGFPVAGVLVSLVSGMLGAAFVVDAATYVVSAVLIAAMAIPAVTGPTRRFTTPEVWRDVVEGWAFLRQQRELFVNTVVTAVAQIGFGAEIVLAVLYAEDVLDHSLIGYPANYSLLLTAIGLGSVLGGLATGTYGDRLRKGQLIIAGLIGVGVALLLAALVSDPVLAVLLFFWMGFFNMLFLVPTITLFQERTPQSLMGRVVSTRQAIVFGVMAASMALCGWLAGFLGPAPVLALGGAVCAVAGAVGLWMPAMRDAR